MYVCTRRWALTAVATLILTGSALAQPPVYGPYPNNPYPYDQSIRGSLGQIIGRALRDVLPSDAAYPVVDSAAGMQGSYYYSDGRYYYVPRPVARGRVYRPVEVQFGGFTRSDDLAAGLERLANDLCLDLHYNYSHNAGFRETYREAYEILRRAQDINRVTRRHDRHAIAERLNGLDELVHHVQRDVRGWTRNSRRSVGQLSVQARLDMIESTLHHLMHDAGIPVHEDDRGHGDDLASRRLETLARQVCLDLHHNYSHNPGFAQTYAEAYRMMDAAQFVYSAHERRDVDHRAVFARLDEIEELARHLQDDVRRWTRYPQREIGQGDVAWKLDRVEATVQQVRDDGHFSTAPTIHAPGHRRGDWDGVPPIPRPQQR